MLASNRARTMLKSEKMKEKITRQMEYDDEMWGGNPDSANQTGRAGIPPTDDLDIYVLLDDKEIVAVLEMSGEWRTHWNSSGRATLPESVTQ